MEIRGRTISYSTFKKREENKKEQELLKEISELESVEALISEAVRYYCFFACASDQNVRGKRRV